MRQEPVDICGFQSVFANHPHQGPVDCGSDNLAVEQLDVLFDSENLFAGLGIEPLHLPPSDADALADALVDYRDEDDLKGLNGAEDPDYEAAGLPWEAKDSAFTDVEELQQVYGMPRWLYQAVLPYITIYSRARGVNPEVAPLQVLFALSDDSPSSLENYIQDRRDNHLARLPLPPPPAIDRSFVTRARGVTLTLSAIGRSPSGKQAAISTVVRIRRGRNRETIETLNWLPYRHQAVEGGGEHGSLPVIRQGAANGPNNE